MNHNLANLKLLLKVALNTINPTLKVGKGVLLKRPTVIKH
jgi:hypothetical protein